MLRIKRRVLTLAQREDLPAGSLTLAKRFRKHGDAIFRFLFDSAVPPTNNGGEQSMFIHRSLLAHWTNTCYPELP